MALPFFSRSFVSISEHFRKFSQSHEVRLFCWSGFVDEYLGLEMDNAKNVWPWWTRRKMILCVFLFFVRLPKSKRKYDTRLMNETRNSRLKGSFLGPRYDHGFHGQCLSYFFLFRSFFLFMFSSIFLCFYSFSSLCHHHTYINPYICTYRLYVHSMCACVEFMFLWLSMFVHRFSIPLYTYTKPVGTN